MAALLRTSSSLSITGLPTIAAITRYSQRRKSPRAPQIHVNTQTHTAGHARQSASAAAGERTLSVGVASCAFARGDGAKQLRCSLSHWRPEGLYSAVSRIGKESPWQAFVRQTLTVALLARVRRLQCNPNVHYRVHKIRH
jgi:hypothetical protein